MKIIYKVSAVDLEERDVDIAVVCETYFEDESDADKYAEEGIKEDLCEYYGADSEEALSYYRIEKEIIEVVPSSKK